MVLMVNKDITSLIAKKKKSTLKIMFLKLLEGFTCYAKLVLAPAEGFGL